MQYRSYYWPDFDEIFWNQFWELNFYTSHFLYSKFFGTFIFVVLNYWKNFLVLAFFGPQILLGNKFFFFDQQCFFLGWIFLDQNIFWIKHFLGANRFFGANIFWVQNLFWTQKFFTPIFFLPQFFLDLKFVLDPKCV